MNLPRAQILRSAICLAVLCFGIYATAQSTTSETPADSAPQNPSTGPSTQAAVKPDEETVKVLYLFADPAWNLAIHRDGSGALSIGSRDVFEIPPRTFDFHSAFSRLMRAAETTRPSGVASYRFWLTVSTDRDFSFVTTDEELVLGLMSVAGDAALRDAPNSERLKTFLKRPPSSASRRGGRTVQDR